jgi:hypothetical protein
MYKLRFTKWEFDKHNRQADMAVMVRKKTAREAEGKRTTFMVRSKEISAHEVNRYVQRKRAFDSAFEEATADQATPIHILCFTPPDSPFPEDFQDTSMVLAPQDTFAADGDITSTRLGKRRRSRSPNVVTANAMVTQPDYRRVRAWARSPSVPRLVVLPDVFRRREMLFGDISSYVQASISSGTWYLSNERLLIASQSTNVDPADFYDFCREATHCFKLSLAPRGRRLLSKAFSLLPTLLREGHPRLLECLVDNLLRIRQRGLVEICAMIQDHIVELARTILPEQHIWCRICTSIFGSDPDHAELLRQSWRCLADAFVYVSGRFSYNSIVTESDMIYRFFGSTDARRAEKLLRGLLADYEKTTKKLDEEALYVIERVADSMYSQGRNADAEVLLEDALLRAREAACLSEDREANLMEQLSRAQYGLFKDDLAEESLRSAIALYTEEHGESDSTVITCSRTLEGWLRAWGRDAEADQLWVKMDEAIGPDDIEIGLTLPSPA